MKNQKSITDKKMQVNTLT